MTSCPYCELPLHDGESCEHALGRALAASLNEIKSLRAELAALVARSGPKPLVPRWRGTIRG